MSNYPPGMPRAYVETYQVHCENGHTWGEEVLYELGMADSFNPDCPVKGCTAPTCRRAETNEECYCEDVPCNGCNHKYPDLNCTCPNVGSTGNDCPCWWNRYLQAVKFFGREIAELIPDSPERAN